MLSVSPPTAPSFRLQPFLLVSSHPAHRSIPSTRPALLVAALAAVAAAACGGGHQSAAHTTPTPTAAGTRAAPGDTLLIVEYIVAPARREQFERFFTDAYFPAMRQMAKSDTGVARVLHQSRLITPTRQSGDGTLSYLLVLDPVVAGESYDIAALLRRVYSPAESSRLYRQLTESWARPFVVRPYVQPRYPDAAP